MSDNNKKKLFPTTRRKFLGLLGAGAGAASLGAAATNEDEQNLAAGGFATNLTNFSKRDSYATGPSGSFDPSVLQTNEFFWETDTGRMGVKSDSGTEHPPIGSQSDPVPSITTEELNRIQTPDPADDVAGIQAAHDSLPADGGMIILKSGEYLSEATYADRPQTELDISKPNVTLTGPRNAIIKLADGVTPAGEGAPMISVSGNFATVRGITIDGNIQNNGGFNNTTGQKDGHNLTANSRGMRFLNVKSINSTGDGVETAGADVVVGDCHFEDNEEQDVHLQGGATDVTIRDNTMIGCRNNGAINTFGSGSNVVKGHKIINNKIIDPTTEAIYLGGADTFEEVEIRGNRITGGTSAAIYTPGDTATFSDIRITENYIADNTSSALVLNTDGTSTNIRITNNDFINNASSGTQHVNLRLGGSGLKVTGNTIKGGGGDGLQIRPLGSDIEDVVVRDNDIIDNNRGDNGANGLIINTPDAAGVANCRIRENEIYTTSAPHYFSGVYPVAGNYTEVEVSENRFKNFTNAAIANPGRFDYVRGNTPVVPVDVTSLKADEGNEAWNDGTTGSVGPHAHDGTNWVGYGPASGSTI